MKEISEVLHSLKNPGSVNLMEVFEEILKNEDCPMIKYCLTQIKLAA